MHFLTVYYYFRKEPLLPIEGRPAASLGRKTSASHLFAALFLHHNSTINISHCNIPQDILYTRRAKLYIYGETLLDKGTGNKTWKERGIGDVRLLRHRENGAIRLLMRQEKTLKIIANFVVQHEIVLTPNVGSDRSWVWNCFDYAGGEQLEETTFALRFADSEIAKEFKEKFEKCQQEMKLLTTGGDDPESTAAGDEAAAALEGLTTKDDAADGKEAA